MKYRIGSKLQMIREDRKLTQAEMADLLGFPTSTYARYERNETSIEAEIIPTIATKLSVGIHELMPYDMGFTNNNHNSGQGGGVNFGTQNFYLGDNAVNKIMSEENRQLKEEISALKAQIQQILNKLS